MKKFFSVFSVLILLFCITGCANTKFLEQDSETLSEGVYATKDSINVGRIDLAADYAQNVCKIVPPPKKPIVIKPIIDKDKKADTILPKNLDTQKVVYVDSTDYAALEQIQADNDQLKSDLDKAQSYSKSADQQVEEDKQIQSALLKDDEAQKTKIANYEKSIFYKAYEWYVFLGWFAPISAVVLIAALIALGIFFPPAIPVILGIFSSIYNVISSIISWIIKKL